MCLTVFVGSNSALPVLPFHKEVPAFWAAEVSPEIAVVRQHLNKPFLYEVGSHAGCSCGFSYDDDASMLNAADVPETVKADWRADYDARTTSVEQLAQYLRLGLQAGSVTVYSCWYGDWASLPTSIRHVRLEHIGGEAFRFIERELLAVDR